MLIGVFGGSFDPPHIDHVSAVTAAKDALALDKVIVLPARQAPHKGAPGASAELRLTWTRQAFEDYDWIEVSDYELFANSPYTLHTLTALKSLQASADNGPHQMFLLMGTDNFVTFERWFGWEEIIQQASLVHIVRPGSEEQTIRLVDQSLKVAGAEITSVNIADQLGISSTIVRNLLRNGEIERASKLLPENIRESVLNSQMYFQFNI